MTLTTKLYSTSPPANPFFSMRQLIFSFYPGLMKQMDYTNCPSLSSVHFSMRTPQCPPEYHTTLCTGFLIHVLFDHTDCSIISTCVAEVLWTIARPRISDCPCVCPSMLSGIKIETSTILSKNILTTLEPSGSCYLPKTNFIHQVNIFSPHKGLKCANYSIVQSPEAQNTLLL